MSYISDTINTTKEKNIQSSVHKNFMNGNSYDIKSPLYRLICMASSSFFGEPMYYKDQRVRKSSLPKFHVPNKLDIKELKYLRTMLNATYNYKWRNMSPANAMEVAIDESLDYDPELTLAVATQLRLRDHIRTTPQIILVRAANHKKVRGTRLIRSYGRGIIQRADEPAIQMAYQLATFGKPFPKALRRMWADFLSSATEYQLAKYKMTSRIVKTVDVGNMAFGKGFYGYETPIGKLMRGELSLNKNIKTWESIRSNGGSWEEAIEVMGHMALLRNIRNFINNKVPLDLWLNKLTETAKYGKQLPFRYLTAHNIINKELKCGDISTIGKILDSIEQCMMISIDNLPHIPGSSLVLADNSGSTQGTPISTLSSMSIAEIGNLMGVLTGYISDEGVLGVFGDRISYLPMRKTASIFDQTKVATNMGKTIGKATENGIWLALNEAIRSEKHWDNIFIYSDMQAGHGGLYGKHPDQYKKYIWNSPDRGNRRYIDVAKMITDYRNKVNKKVNVFMIQIAGYEDTLMPEFYDRTFILGGWSGNIFKFARRMIDLANETDNKQKN